MRHNIILNPVPYICVDDRDHISDNKEVAYFLLSRLNFQPILLTRRWPGEIRSASGSEAMHGSVDPGHGPGYGRVQDQAERHPGALQRGHQTDVRLMRHTQIVLSRRATPTRNIGASAKRIVHKTA